MSLKICMQAFSQNTSAVFVNTLKREYPFSATCRCVVCWLVWWCVRTFSVIYNTDNHRMLLNVMLYLVRLDVTIDNVHTHSLSPSLSSLLPSLPPPPPPPPSSLSVLQKPRATLTFARAPSHCRLLSLDCKSRHVSHHHSWLLWPYHYHLWLWRQYTWIQNGRTKRRVVNMCEFPGFYDNDVHALLVSLFIKMFSHTRPTLISYAPFWHFHTLTVMCLLL